jgi:type II secretory pathway pseudopilin PulG
MSKLKNDKGISIIESLVCLVVIGIGFIAVLQLSAFSIGSMDRATEKNKLNYLSEMVLEDMIGDPDNLSDYGSFNETCGYNNTSGSKLHDKKKDKWRNKLQEKGFKKQLHPYGYVDVKPSCRTGDTKKTFVGNNKTSGRVNILTGQGKRKKYLGVVVK